MTNYSFPLIDREIFFGNPVISGAQISPDGKYISFIKPLEDVMNIWVKRSDDAFDEALPLTNDKTRPIRSYFWSRDSKYILYVQDKGGDENFHVYAVDPSSAISSESIPDALDLTPYGDIAAFILSLPKANGKEINVGINDRDKAWHDFYAINIETGQRRLILKNEDRFNAVYFDLDNQLKLSSKSNQNGGTEIYKKTERGFQKILEATLEESISPTRFRKDGKAYFVSNVGNPDLAGLYLNDFETDTLEFIESDPENKVDLEDVSFSLNTDELIATIYISDKKKIYWKNEDFKKDYNYLKEKFPSSEISISSTTKDERQWLIYTHSDIDPGSAYQFNRDTHSIDFLYSPRPELPTEYLCSMEPVSYNSLDGLNIPAYITRPKTESKNLLPAVIMPHGGPWARDYWGYNSFAQFLANRGYAVLQVNFRGSTGYGKAFLNAAINEWGEKMQDDLTAGAKYLIDNEIAEPNAIAIMGGSYGGYATLAGLTFTPEVYAAGISIVGPSNLFTLLETIPPYWESARAMFHKRMGNPNTEEGKAQLKRQSPFFHTSNIKSPLMVAQGANDPRVKKSESDQIVIAMRELNLNVEYLNFPDEGHGFANPRNNMAFIAAMERFLSDQLGGRYQKEIPDHLNTILEKVTVDINSLKMPLLINNDIRNSQIPTVITSPESYSAMYKIQLAISGQLIDFEINRSVNLLNNEIELIDKAISPMGEMIDKTIVLKSDFSLVERSIKQDPMSISLKLENEKISGSITIQDEVKPIELAIEKDFIIDGPALDLFLQNINYNTPSQYLYVFDAQNQSFTHHHISVEKEEIISGYNCLQIKLESLEGPQKTASYWISKDASPILVKKESILPEMGGAKMTWLLIIENH